MQVHLGGADGRHDGAHHALEIGFVAVLHADYLFPVPLVHVDGVEIVQIFIAADGVHIAVQALAHAEVVVLQGLALPFCQRLHHLCFNAAVLDIKGDFALHAVQVVVQAGGCFQKQRRRHTVQVQRGAQCVGKQALDRADGALGVVQVQRGRVVCRNDGLAHNRIPLFLLDSGPAFPYRAQFLNQKILAPLWHIFLRK